MKPAAFDLAQHHECSGGAISLTLPIRLESTANLREHWAKRHARTALQRNAVRLALASKFRAMPMALPVAVGICRIAPRPLDFDNLTMSAKALRDGIADALGLRDDRECADVAWGYSQRRGKPREYAVEIRVQARS